MNMFNDYRTQIAIVLTAICEVANSLGIPIPPGTDKILLMIASFFFAIKVQKVVKTNKDNADAMNKLAEALSQYKPESGK